MQKLQLSNSAQSNINNWSKVEKVHPSPNKFFAGSVLNYKFCTRGSHTDQTQVTQVTSCCEGFFITFFFDMWEVDRTDPGSFHNVSFHHLMSFTCCAVAWYSNAVCVVSVHWYAYIPRGGRVLMSMLPMLSICCVYMDDTWEGGPYAHSDWHRLLSIHTHVRPPCFSSYSFSSTALCLLSSYSFTHSPFSSASLPLPRSLFDVFAPHSRCSLGSMICFIK